MKPVVIDFETEAINDRPHYPPTPVGLAVLDPHGEWSFPLGTYITDMDVARRFLADLYHSGRELLFHNGKFDQEVALEHFGLPLLPWHRAHDTLFQLFLADPHALSLSLKPAAEHWLGMPPEEQDVVRTYLIKHGIVRGNQKDWGAYIARCPRGITGRYAIGDCVRTLGIHELIHPQLDEGMRDAYDRERRLMPILVENERRGMRVSLERLQNDIAVYEKALDLADNWLREVLNTTTLNVDADVEVASALKKSGIIKSFVKTKTGRDSVAKKNLTLDMFVNPQVHEVLGYRNRLQTSLSMSLRPWCNQAEANNGYIHTSWNQVRQAHGNDGAKGTRTGRLSCSRFQNITKDWYDKGDYVYPQYLGVPDLPLVRSYICGDEGDLFCHRDYNQQEFRILAHYEGDQLAQRYREDEKFDMHKWMHAAIVEMAQQEYHRRHVKIINFMELYGGGNFKMAGAIGTDEATVKKLRAMKDKLVPKVRLLMKATIETGRRGGFIRTWGGRIYYSEEPKVINHRVVRFDYKLLNYLVQGSAADCTKEAVILFNQATKHARFLVTVHDEINFSCPPEYVEEELKILEEVMLNVESKQGKFEVPMRSDAKVGPTWGEIKKYEQNSKLVAV